MQNISYLNHPQHNSVFNVSPTVHCEPKKNTKMFLSYLPQNPVDSDKIWYTFSWINFRYSSLNVFQLTWIMSLHYLVKLSVCVLSVNSNWNCEPKNTPKVFLSHRLQNHADSDKNFVLIVLNIFATEYYKCFPPRLNNASTLPCET